MLDKVIEVSPGKVNYIGYSMGTSQMWYALATDNAGIDSRVKKIILVAPCLYNVSGSVDGMNDYLAMTNTFRGEGVY